MAQSKQQMLAVVTMTTSTGAVATIWGLSNALSALWSSMEGSRDGPGRGFKSWHCLGNWIDLSKPQFTHL